MCSSFVTSWTVAHQAPLSTGSSRQEYWSGLPCPPPGGLPDPGIKSASLCLLHWQVDPLPLVPPGKPNKGEKRKWSRSVVSDSLRPHGLQPTRLLRPWGFPGKSTGVGCIAFSCCACICCQIKKKKVIAKTSVKELTHFDFFNEFYDFMIVLICNYQIQAQRDWVTDPKLYN